MCIARVLPFSRTDYISSTAAILITARIPFSGGMQKYALNNIHESQYYSLLVNRCFPILSTSSTATLPSCCPVCSCHAAGICE